MNIKFETISKNELLKIKNLWEELNKIHREESPHFRDYYSQFTFEDRIRGIMKLDEKNIRIEILSEYSTPMGYCISTARGDTGEVDSLYIDERLRNRGHGRELVKGAMRWLEDEKGCTRILIAVAHGHDSVIKFYERLGFFPRITYFQKMN